LGSVIIFFDAGGRAPPGVLRVNRTRTSLLKDFTARYSSPEAWLYDQFVAPAVMDMGDGVMDGERRG
jgi:hypothetical protein